MKTSICKFLILLVLFIISCRRTEILPDYIVVGQKVGKSIDYFDYNPDIKCSFHRDINKEDTIINLDLNMDGDDDFKIRLVESCCALGTGINEVTMIPLGNNKICIIPAPSYPDSIMEGCCTPSKLDWVDTLSINDTINSKNNWTNNESLIYHYSWLISNCTMREGLWHYPMLKQNRYIGFIIVEKRKNYYGWIGMYSNYIISDCAIIQEYDE